MNFLTKMVALLLPTPKAGPLIMLRHRDDKARLCGFVNLRHEVEWYVPHFPIIPHNMQLHVSVNILDGPKCLDIKCTFFYSLSILPKLRIDNHSLRVHRNYGEILDFGNISIAVEWTTSMIFGMLQTTLAGNHTTNLLMARVHGIYVIEF